MLEKAIFRKHTHLFLFMAKRKYFSQKELISWGLEHGEFKDKDSIENKGQFRDKMIEYGILRKHTYREFKESYPDQILQASLAYSGPKERKRIILEFDSDKFISLDYPDLIGFDLPFFEFVNSIEAIDNSMDVSELVKAFVFGCSMHGLLLFNQKLAEKLNLLAKHSPEIDLLHLPLVDIAKLTMIKWLKEKVNYGIP